MKHGAAAHEGTAASSIGTEKKCTAASRRCQRTRGPSTRARGRPAGGASAPEQHKPARLAADGLPRQRWRAERARSPRSRKPCQNDDAVGRQRRPRERYARSRRTTSHAQTRNQTWDPGRNHHVTTSGGADRDPTRHTTGMPRGIVTARPTRRASTCTHTRSHAHSTPETGAREAAC